MIYAYAYDEGGWILTDGTKENIHRDEILKDSISKKAVSSNSLLIQYKSHVLDIAEAIYLGNDKLGGVRIGFSLEKSNKEISVVRNRNIIFNIVAILIVHRSLKWHS